MPAPEAQIHVQSHDAQPETTAGNPLDSGVRSHFERSFGADLSSVRVHDDPAVAERGAEAIADGEHLHFRPGAYDPGSTAGADLLGHELTHVMQQRAGAIDVPQHKGGLVVDGGLEAQADQLGAMAARGERVSIPGSERAAAAPRGIQQPKMSVSVLATPGADVKKVTVGWIDIAGRPERKKFATKGGGSSEGDHTTAWSVMRIGVCNRLAGLTLVKAVHELGILVAEADSLPGAARTTADKERNDFTKKARTAIDTCAKAALSGLDVSVSVAQSALQQYIAKYLEYRNSLPLSVMDRGRATGDGEATPLKVLQFWEHGLRDKGAKPPTKGEQKDILCALGALYSPDVTADVENDEADPKNLPGMKSKEKTASLQAALLKQHLTSIASAFPTIASIVDLGGVVPGNEWKGTVPKGADKYKTGADFGVQLVLDEKTEAITKVLPSGRPQHGTVGGLEGDHTTAYVVSVRTIEHACTGQSLDDAVKNLVAIEKEFRDMPGAKPGRKDAMSDERVGHLNAADATATNARKEATTAATLTSVQAYAGALLYYRNSMALTVVAAESTSTGKGESKRMGILESCDFTLSKKGAVKASDLIGAIAGLFDRGVIDKVLDTVGQNQSLLKDYDISNVMVSPQQLGAKKKDKTQALTDVDDLPESFNVEELATQDVLHDFKPDEIVSHSRKDKVPGHQRGENAEELFSALLEQHLRSIALVAPFAFGGLDDEMLGAMVLSLVGATLIDSLAILGRVKGLLTKTTTGLVANDVKKATTASSKKKGGKKRKSKIEWGNEDSDFSDS